MELAGAKITLDPDETDSQRAFCVPYLYANLDDCFDSVRKNAQEAVLGFMIHLSYEAMVRNTEKLKVFMRIIECFLYVDFFNDS